jgi:hypothetical protein
MVVGWTGVGVVGLPVLFSPHLRLRCPHVHNLRGKAMAVELVGYKLSEDDVTAIDQSINTRGEAGFTRRNSARAGGGVSGAGGAAF